MRLIELSANKDTFKTVHFKKNGLNIILGKKVSLDLRKTYNGVGKSLLTKLVHFCLGSDSNEEYEKRLVSWVFTLKFEIEGEFFTVSRSTSSQREVMVNSQIFSLDNYRLHLEGKLFPGIDDSIKNLTFRSLITRFIRPKKESYLNFDQPALKEEPYGILINTAFLLGLDPLIISRKFELKEALDKVKDIEKVIQKDEIFLKFFNGTEKIGIAIFELNEKINKINQALLTFQVAEDYDEIKNETNTISERINEVKNISTIIKNQVFSIDKSLTLKAEESIDRVVGLYEKAKVDFSKSVIKTLENVTKFHQQIIKNREKRLLNEKLLLTRKLKESEDFRKELGKKLESNLKYLNAHGAFNEYIALTNKLSDLNARLQKLEDYQKLLNEYKSKEIEFKTQIDSENKESLRYLEQAQPLINNNLHLFRSLSSQFYEDKPGGIEIKNNEGINRVRFNIEAEIQDDASDGVNEVKIFCFDWTILIAQHNHKMDMLWHDSRLFSEMDPRQRMRAFKVAHEVSADKEFQYIVTINEDSLLTFKDLLDEDEYKNIIENNIILQLTDESEESKLLGLEVNLKE